MRFIILIFLVLPALHFNAQPIQGFPNDGLIGQYTDPPPPVPYPSLREADLMWSKRIWRRIDLRQKFNHPLYYPEQPQSGWMSLFDVIKTDLLSSEPTIRAYSTGFDGTDDRFTTPLTREEVKGILISNDSVSSIDPVTNEPIMVPVTQEMNSRNIVMFEIKEDWFFDRQRSVLDVRIIGLCPIVEVYDDFGEFKGYKRLFWLYFPRCRSLLSRYRAFNRFNDAERMSYDDLFMKRMFSSYIIKESNVYDRFISEYKVGLDALLEGKAIKEDLFNFEQDLWHW